MAWTVDDAKQWVEERGGVDGGGLEALEMNIINGSFGAERMPVAQALLQSERDRKNRHVELANEQALREQQRQSASRRQADAEAQRTRDDERRQRELALTERNVHAAESQAESAREALKTSHVATGISLLALLVAAIALAAQFMGRSA